MTLNAVTKKVLQDIFLVLSFLFMDNMKHKDDYRVAIVKEQVRKKSGPVSLVLKFVLLLY